LQPLSQTAHYRPNASQATETPARGLPAVERKARPDPRGPHESTLESDAQGDERAREDRPQAQALAGLLRRDARLRRGRCVLLRHRSLGASRDQHFAERAVLIERGVLVHAAKCSTVPMMITREHQTWIVCIASNNDMLIPNGPGIVNQFQT